MSTSGVSSLKQYNFHDLLRVQIFRERESLLDYYLDSVFSPYEVKTSEEPDLSIRIGRGRPSLRGSFWVDGKYAIREDAIYYENRYKSARWGIEVQGPESPNTLVSIHCNSFARPVLAGETLYSFIRLKLAQKGFVLLHASGVGIGDRGFFFAARGGVGKTITAIHSVRRGAALYGDDTVILGRKGELSSFAVPFNLRFTYDVERLLGIRFSKSLRLELALKQVLSFFTGGRYRLFTLLPPQEVFPAAIGKRVSLAGGFLLLQGSRFEIEEVGERDLFLDQLVKVVQFESAELIALLRAYAHVFPRSGLVRFWDDFRESLEEALREIPCFRVTLPTVYRPEYFESLWTRMKTCTPLITASMT